MAFTISQLEALIWTPMSVATVIVGLRLFTRVKLRNHGVEDLFMTLCWIFAILTVTAAEVEIRSRDKDQRRAAWSGLGALAGGILSLSFGKVAVILALLRLTVKTMPKRRWFLIANMAVFTILSIGCLIVNVVKPCSSSVSLFESPFCVKYNSRISLSFTLGWSLHGAILDIVLSVLASIMVYHLRISQKTKIGLYLLFGLGWIGGPFSIIRAVTVVTVNSDVFWVSTALEISLLIICASVPMLMPLVHYWFYGKAMTPRRNNTPQYGSRSFQHDRKPSNHGAAEDVGGSKHRGHASKRSASVIELLEIPERDGVSSAAESTRATA